MRDHFLTFEKSIRAIAVIFSVLLLLVVNREFSVADNGDFSRYMGGVISKPLAMEENWPAQGTDDWHKRFFSEPQVYWSPPNAGQYSEQWFTSASLFWNVGYQLNSMFFTEDVVNIRYLGLMFFLVNLTFLTIFLMKMPLNSLGGVVVFFGGLLIVSDAKITAFFNSLYAESVPVLALFVAFACLSPAVSVDSHWSGNRHIRYLLLAVVVAFFIFAIFSKRQYLYFIVAAILLFGYAVFSSRLKFLKKSLVVFCGATILLLSTYWVTSSQRLDNKSESIASRTTSYHALYFGLLPHAADPPKLMERLGLPQDSRLLIGKSAWNEDSMRLIAAESNINVGNFLKAIVLDPMAFLKSALFNAKEVGNFNIPLGMVYGVEYKLPPVLISSLSTLSSIVAGTGYLILTVCSAFVLMIFPAGSSADQRFTARIFAFIFFSLFAADIFVSTFDGQQEARKHVLLASICSLMMCLLAFARLIDIGCKWFSRPHIYSTGKLMPDRG